MPNQAKENLNLKELIDVEVMSTPLFMLKEELYKSIRDHIARKFAEASLVSSPTEKARLEALYTHIVIGV